MRLKVGAVLALACGISVALAGCGGSGGSGAVSTVLPPPHTYVLVPTGSGSPTGGVYVEIVSPFAIPANALATSNAKLVAHPKGLEDCSDTKPMQGLSGSAADLNGKTVTVRVYGTNPTNKTLCSKLGKGTTFNVTTISGT